MKNILTPKVAAGVMILLFLMGISMRRSEARRVPMNGHGGERAHNKVPSLPVLHILRKSPPPCTGNCPGYTPGGKHAPKLAPPARGN
ncbi:hypothetical protein ACJRO7_004049 [Eucalyptus globulus]|uniref:Uncharacterized protein n=1 Tax=Eucalyptus globulus TaxID=34317 RepID=A0ABD3IXT8_EUCGL